MGKGGTPVIAISLNLVLLAESLDLPDLSIPDILSLALGA